MTLRQKTLITLAATLLGLVVAMYLMSQNIVGSAFAMLEQRGARVNVERVLNTLGQEQSTMESVARDWAAWDDTYAFMQDHNDHYLRSNLQVDTTFINNQVNVMLLFDAAHTLVFGRAFDLQTRQEIPVPQELFGHLLPGGAIFQYTDVHSTVTGLLSLAGSPLIVSAQSILTSDGNGPVRGTFLWGRFLNSSEVEQLARQTRLSLGIHPLDSPDLPIDLQAGRPSLSESQSIVIRPIDAETIAGYAWLKDIYGTPVATLKVEMPRDIYAYGRATIWYVTLAMLVTGAVFVTVVLLLLDRLVLSRLYRLTTAVFEIGATGKPSARVSPEGLDELGRLATNINGMLHSRQAAEEALALQAQELARSNKDLEQFAYVASHDLQEPLRMVTSYTELLARRYGNKLDADAGQFIAYAVEGARQMQALINDLLAYSRVGTQGKDLQPTDGEALLSRVLANLQAAIRESGAVVTHDAMPNLMADPLQLGQVFQNLLSNAIKFRGDRPPKIHIGAEQKDGAWLFYVRDNGIGIDPKYFHRLFVIFQRLHTREQYPGTGIGLAICKKIVERHGGHIWVESNPQGGSTFYFTIYSTISDIGGVRREPVSVG